MTKLFSIVAGEVAVGVTAKLKLVAVKALGVI